MRRAVLQLQRMCHSSYAACRSSTAAGQLQYIRSASSAAGVVDQMLQYVNKDLHGFGQAAIDVLRSGLSMQPDPNAGYDSGRLHMALSEAYAAEHNWAEAASAAVAAAKAFPPTTSPASAGLARLQACRLFLAGSRDEDAASTAATTDCSKLVPVLLMAEHASQLLVSNAVSAQAIDEAWALSLRQQQQQQQQQHQQREEEEGGALLHAVAHKVLGDAALAKGDRAAAELHYQSAKEACSSSSSSSSSSRSSSSSSSSSSSGFVSERLRQEVMADIVMGQAQVVMAAKQWDKAEELLSEALKAAEAAAAGPSGSSSSSSALLAPVLLLLATGYCRSAKVIMAEGLLREVAKLMGVGDPHRLVDGPSSHQVVHPSLKAAACWRYCQLLTALPNRSAEAASWGALARRLWATGAGPGFVGMQLEEVLGDDVALTGKGQHGRGVVVSLLTRRLLPVLSE